MYMHVTWALLFCHTSPTKLHLSAVMQRSMSCLAATCTSEPDTCLAAGPYYVNDTNLKSHSLDTGAIHVVQTCRQRCWQVPYKPICQARQNTGLQPPLCTATRAQLPYSCNREGPHAMYAWLHTLHGCLFFCRCLPEADSLLYTATMRTLYWLGRPDRLTPVVSTAMLNCETTV